MEFTLNTLHLSPDAPQIPYRRRTDEEKKAVHWGQRKLLLGEIAFLTLYWDEKRLPNPTVVYVGASPGTHIPFLSQLFPTITFHLYDPLPFNFSESNRLILYPRHFTDDDARRWSHFNDEVLLISDIRSSDYTQLTTEENEKMIDTDMTTQKNWYLIMKPVKALLKFRLPYSYPTAPRTVSYLAGDLLLQPWGPQTTTETRLIPKSTDEIDWDIVKYESQMFYHNTVSREQCFYFNPLTSHPAKKRKPVDPPELLNDYDSVAEAVILKAYLNKIGWNNDLEREVIKLSREITRTLHPKKTLKFLRQSQVKTTNRRAVEAHSFSV